MNEPSRSELFVTGLHPQHLPMAAIAFSGQLFLGENYGKTMAGHHGFTIQIQAIPTDVASNHLMGKFLTMDLSCGFSYMFQTA